MKTFKWYYKNYICETLQEYFPNFVSYNRFVELMQSIIIPLTLYLINLSSMNYFSNKLKLETIDGFLDIKEYPTSPAKRLTKKLLIERCLVCSI